MTETTCTGTCMEPEDNSVGRVGPPMAGVEIKLVNWEEGNYRVSDRYLIFFKDFNMMLQTIIL